MKLLERIATKSGVSLPAEPSPFPVNYHPIPGQYITFSSKTGQESKNYPHWAEIVRWLQPILLKYKIFIVQIGGKGEEPFNGVVSKIGLTFRESSFLVQNSLLHLSGDSCFVHFAGMVKTPIVAVYGATLPESAGPYYKGDFHPIEDRSELPSYLTTEQDPQIAKIKPETIVNRVLEVLGLKERVDIETIEFGSLYHQKQISYIPDFLADGQKLAEVKLVIRLDGNHNENYAAAVLQHRRKPTVIIAEKPMTEDFLKMAKGKVARLYIRLKDDYQVDYIQTIKESGIPYTLIWEGKKENLGQAKIKLFEYEPIVTPQSRKNPSVDKNCYFKTQQAFLGRGKKYFSMWHYKHFEEGQGLIGNAIESEDFWESAEGFFFYKRPEKKQ